MKCTELFHPKPEGDTANLLGTSQAQTRSNDQKGLRHLDIDGKKAPFLNGDDVSNVNEHFHALILQPLAKRDVRP